MKKTYSTKVDMNPILPGMVRNKEIIQSLAILRENHKSKYYAKRQKHLFMKGQALTKIGNFNLDPRSRPSLIALNILEKLHPELKAVIPLTDTDWGEDKLFFNSVQALPQRKDDETTTIFREVSMEAKRITDKRGIDNKITLRNPKEDTKIRTPWYYIPNIVDFEISKKLGFNAALLLINQQLSRGKAKEDIIP